MKAKLRGLYLDFRVLIRSRSAWSSPTMAIRTLVPVFPCCTTRQPSSIAYSFISSTSEVVGRSDKPSPLHREAVVLRARKPFGKDHLEYRCLVFLSLCILLFQHMD